MLLSTAAAVVPLGLAYVGKRVIDAVIAGQHDQALRWVLVELGLVALFAFVQRGIALSRSLLGARLSVDVNVMRCRPAALPAVATAA